MAEREQRRVKILKAGLDDSELRPGHLIFRGVVDQGSLDDLLSGSYQREVLPINSKNSIIKALGLKQALPDIELGMRGDRFFMEGPSAILQDPVYIIDGLQRVSAAKYMLAAHPDLPVRIGATIHLNTTEQWERDRFEILNGKRTRVSANVMLRNMRHDNNVILTLFGMSQTEKEFPLVKKVSWSQRFARGDLLSGMVLVRIAANLSAHKTGSKPHGIAEIRHTTRMMENEFGIKLIRENTMAFFKVVEDAWGLEHITQDSTAPQLRAGFLQTLASIFSDHKNFWIQGDKVLDVDLDTQRKLAKFELRDPSVLPLVGAGGQARNLLYALIRDHINRGRTTNRLMARDFIPEQGAEARNEEESEDA